ncbi:MAG: hypothetical protein MUP41_09145, partial [Desulfobacterales bacterium]|nr:hypothetical protein [Desulfobacterales bacterium]
MFKNLLKIFVFAVCLSASLGYALPWPAQVVKIDPVSVWDAEGNAWDDVGASATKPKGNNPGIPSDAVTYVPGQFGRAFHFDGSSFVKILPSDSLRPKQLTVLAYVKAE